MSGPGWLRKLMIRQAAQQSGSTGIWPGNGPWSHLPPWERPGWQLGGGRGRGYCWLLLNEMLKRQKESNY